MGQGVKIMLAVGVVLVWDWITNPDGFEAMASRIAKAAGAAAGTTGGASAVSQAGASLQGIAAAAAAAYANATTADSKPS